MINPTGTTVKKNIKIRIIGENIFPNKIPNLAHNIFGKVNSEEFKNPNKKKIRLIINNHQKLLALEISHIPIIKKKIENVYPKLLLEPIFE